MLRDLGSRDTQFINVIKEVRSGVLKLAGVSEQEFTMIPIQGSGTFGIEAVISSVVPRNGRLLIVANGAYGQRQEKIAKAYGMTYTLLNYSDDTPPNEKDIAAALEKHSDITHVSMVHSETTSGIMNDIHTIGKLVAKHNKSFIVDAMSSFGAIPIDFKSAGIDFLITSANKCIQGSPGFAIVIGRRSSVEKAKGNARTLTYVRCWSTIPTRCLNWPLIVGLCFLRLDIWDQNKGLDGDGQFRFTPPTHSLLAFRQALKELEEEGGVLGRQKRYQQNHDIVSTYLFSVR